MEVKNAADYMGWLAEQGRITHTYVIPYMQHWARLMEAQLAAGAKLEDIAHFTSLQAAQHYGPSGAIHHAAVGILTLHWVHGDALRRWHNEQHARTPAEASAINARPGAVLQSHLY